VLKANNKFVDGFVLSHWFSIDIDAVWSTSSYFVLEMETGSALRK
jgi:hypothetical protein